MRIAILSPFYPYRGGIAQFNAPLYRELEKEHDVRAYTFTKQYPGLLFPGQTQYVPDDDNADPIPAIRVLDSINPISYFKTANLIRDFNPELLLINFWMPFFAPALGYVGGKFRKSSTKVIGILHNAIPHERRIGDFALLRYFLNRCEGFVAMSKIVQNDLIKLKPEAHSVLTPHPVYAHFGQPVARESARQKLGIPSDKKVILFFGFIREYKGLDILIRAMKHLSDDYLLIIAGEVYGDFAQYQQMIDATRSADKIKLFVHYINGYEVPFFFSAADVAVLPYKSATQSGIAQIACHFKLPLIVTNVGGLAEAVEDGVTGLVARSFESEELAAKIKYYFENQLQEQYSIAVEKASYKYSWAAFVKKIFDLYNTMASTPDFSPPKSAESIL